MTRNRSCIAAIIVSCFIFISVDSPCSYAKTALERTEVLEAVEAAMNELEMTRGASGFLLLTNAFYGQLNGKSAEACRDVLSEATGCTLGKRTLLDVHTAFDKPLWFSLFEKNTHRLVYTVRKNGKFIRQTIDASPENLLTPEGWKKASQGVIGGKNLFRTASISLSWAEDAAWEIMKTAAFHDHLCPGVNIGYLTHVYLQKNMPLQKGETYRFFGALPKCYMDTLQVVYNATLGKQASFGVAMSKEQLAEYKSGGAVPSITAMKINKSKDTCEGVVLGFSWKRIMDDLGLDIKDFAPKGGPSNPVFFLTRVKACRKMAMMPLESKMPWLVEMKRFSGTADLAEKICNAHGDPYAVVWKR